jgi:dTDP-glucose 4,6-dehydratase
VKRILVTGAFGFVGRHVVSYVLDETDWEVVAVDTKTHGFLPEDRVQVVNANLEHQWTFELNERVGRVDAVFHLAAASDVKHSLDYPVQHVHRNVDLTLWLLEWARRRSDQLTHVVQVSTNEVYGPSTRGRSREWDPVVPVTPYSASKAAQEALATAWWRSFGVPLVLVNTQHLFGEGQPRQRFIPTVVDQLLEGQPVRLVGQLHLPPVRRWLHARDLASALVWTVERGRPASRAAELPDRWHVAGETLNCLVLAERIAELLEKPLEVEWVEFGRAGYEQRYVLDTQKVHAAGWRPPLGFPAGLERAVGWAVKTHHLGRGS